VFGEDVAQLAIIGARIWHMGIASIAGRHCKAGVMAFDEVRQPGIGLIDGINARDAHGLEQAILQHAVGAFHPALGLGRVGADAFNAQRRQRAPELRYGVIAGVAAIDAEDAMRSL